MKIVFSIDDEINPPTYTEALTTNSDDNDDNDNDDNDSDSNSDSDNKNTHCLKFKKNGEPCSRLTKNGEKYCYYHSGTCTAITSKNVQCSNGCMENTDRCGYHAATCKGQTKAGSKCQLAAEFCRYHRHLNYPNDAASISNQSSTSTPIPIPKVKNQCCGLTQKKQRCRLNAAPDSDYCHFH